MHCCKYKNAELDITKPKFGLKIEKLVRTNKRYSVLFQSHTHVDLNSKLFC